MGEPGRCQKNGKVEQLSKTSAKTSNSNTEVQVSKQLVLDLSLH